MGYKRKAPKVFKVAFAEGHEFEGLEMTTRGLSVAEFAEFGIKLQRLGTGLGDQDTPEDAVEALKAFMGALDASRAGFADALLSWNMEEDDGTPTPANLEGVNRLDDVMFLSLVREWLEAIGGVGDDLGKDSGSGETSPELSSLMEVSSLNPTN